MEWTVGLREGDEMVLWNDLPFLKAMAVFDETRGYRKVPFGNGGFRLRTGGGEMVVEEIGLQSVDLMKLAGELRTRRPSKQEVYEALNLEWEEEEMEESGDAALKEEKLKEEKLTLKKAGKASEGEKMKIEGINLALLGKSGGFIEQAREEAIRAEGELLRVDGKLRVAVLPDSLGRYPALEGFYPLDEGGQWRWIGLGLESRLIDVTEEETEILYKQARDTTRAERGGESAEGEE